MIKKNNPLVSRETHIRTIIKAISWRMVATLTTMTIVFLFTREILLSIEVGFIEVMAKITFYYVHERTWDKVSWGKSQHPLSSIPVKRKLDPEDMEKIKSKLRELGYLD